MIVGIASWYGSFHQGRPTSNGERFDKRAETCAHKTLPFGSVVMITDTDTGKTATCRINDRGPYKPGRIIDAAERVATNLGFHDKGTARHVRLDVLRWGDTGGAGEPVEVAEDPLPAHRHAPHPSHHRGHRRR